MLVFTGLSLLFLAYIIHQVRRGRLDLPFSFLWLVTGAVAAIVSAYPKIINLTAPLLGIKYPLNLLYSLAIFLLAAILLQLTLWITLLNRRLVKVVQRLGLEKGGRGPSQEGN